MKRPAHHRQIDCNVGRLPRLGAYSALCASFLALSSEEAHAQIIYTDIDPDEVLDGSSPPFSPYQLDLDGNGSIDFEIQANYYYGYNDNVSAKALGSNAIAGTGSTGISFCAGPFALDNAYAAAIDGALSWRSSSQFLNCGGAGNWSDGETAYLALRLQDGPNVHYGWLRVTLNNPLSCTLLDYALESTPGLAIAAGDQGECPVPGQLAVLSSTPNSATLTWDEAPAVLSYDVFYRRNAGGPIQSTTVASAPTTLSGLQQNTLYDWSVRATCSSGTTGFAGIQLIGISDLPSILDVRKLSASSPGFPASPPDGLSTFDGFGEGITRIGDADGDGTEEFLVGASFSSILGLDGGMRWISYDSTGNLTAVRRIDLGPDEVLSARPVGDLDGNGVGDIALLDDNEAYTLLLGPDTTATAAIPLMDGGSPITGEHLGSLGDFDGDGNEDIVLREGFGSVVVKIVLLNSDGTAKSVQTVDLTPDGVGGSFFEQLDGIGDVDGNGTPDLAVGDGLDSEDAGNAGAVYVVLFNSDASVKAVQKINRTNSGAWLSNGIDDLFGRSLAGIGDIDGDGVPDLLVGSEEDNDPSTDAGSSWLVSLNSDGSLKAARKIADGKLGLNLGLDADDRFSESVGLIGDTDGDGFPELGITATRDDDGGSNQGAVYLLELDKPACARPDNTRLDALNPTNVTVAWDPVDEATQYEIEGRKVGGALKAGLIAGTSFIRSGLIPNADYEWHVRSICGTLQSAWTDFFPFTTPAMRYAGMDPDQVRLFPNPADDRLQISLPAGNYEIRLLDLQGRELRRTAAALESTSTLQMPLQDISAGLYTVEVSDMQGAVSSHMLVVE